MQSQIGNIISAADAITNSSYHVDKLITTEFENQVSLGKKRLQFLNAFKKNVQTVGDKFSKEAFEAQFDEGWKMFIHEMESIQKFQSNKISPAQYVYLVGYQADLFDFAQNVDLYRLRSSTNTAIIETVDGLLKNFFAGPTLQDAISQFALSNPFQKVGRKGARSAGSGVTMERFRQPIKLPTKIVKNEGLIMVESTIASAELSRGTSAVRFLLYGGPGIGKSLAAMYATTEWNAGDNYFVLSNDTLQSKFVGDTEAAIQDLLDYFTYNSKERGVILMDEADEFLQEIPTPATAGAKTKIQTALSDVTNFPNVIIFLATNFPMKIAEPIRNRILFDIAYPTPTLKDILSFVWNQLDLSEKEYLVPTAITKLWEPKLKEVHNFRDAASRVSTYKNQLYDVLIKSAYVYFMVSASGERILTFNVDPFPLESDTFTSFSGMVPNKVYKNTITAKDRVAYIKDLTAQIQKEEKFKSGLILVARNDPTLAEDDVNMK